MLRALKSCNIEKQSVHRVVLVGGSSRLHAVSDVLAKTFNRHSIVHEDVDTIVSISAVITALRCVCAYLPSSVKSKIADIFSKTLCTAIALPLGIRTIHTNPDGSASKFNFSPVVDANSMYPFSKCRVFLCTRGTKDQITLHEGIDADARRN